MSWRFLFFLIVGAIIAGLALGFAVIGLLTVLGVEA